jgi:hypothetical protein
MMADSELLLELEIGEAPAGQEVGIDSPALVLINQLENHQNYG